MIKGKVAIPWRDKKPTEEQISAIGNMQTALGLAYFIPESRGDCADLIGQLKTSISNNISITGQISPRYWNGDLDNQYDDYWDGDNYGNGNDYFDDIF